MIDRAVLVCSVILMVGAVLGFWGLRSSKLALDLTAFSWYKGLPKQGD